MLANASLLLGIVLGQMYTSTHANKTKSMYMHPMYVLVQAYLAQPLSSAILLAALSPQFLQHRWMFKSKTSWC